MGSIWIANYEGNEIRIENSGFRGEKLFVNNKLQDKRLSFFSSNLTGHLISKEGKRMPIKANLGGNFTVECWLFIDDDPIEITKIK